MKITTSLELLDWFKTVADIDSAYMAAKITGISKQMISDVRKEKSDFSPHTIMQLLVIADHPQPLETLAVIEANKAKKRGDEKLETIWRSQVA